MTPVPCQDIVLTLQEKLSIRSIAHFALVLEEQYNLAKVHLLHEEELIAQVSRAPRPGRGALPPGEGPVRAEGRAGLGPRDAVHFTPPSLGKGALGASRVPHAVVPWAGVACRAAVGDILCATISQSTQSECPKGRGSLG